MSSSTPGHSHGARLRCVHQYYIQWVCMLAQHPRSSRAFGGRRHCWLFGLSLLARVSLSEACAPLDTWYVLLQSRYLRGSPRRILRLETAPELVTSLSRLLAQSLAGIRSSPASLPKQWSGWRRPQLALRPRTHEPLRMAKALRLRTRRNGTTGEQLDRMDSASITAWRLS